MGMQKHYDCPVFHPTLKDVSGSFEAYMERVEKRFAGAGVCKIVAPKGWQPRQAGYSDASLADLEIPRPISQHATGTRGTFRVLLVERKSMSAIGQFKPRATNPDNQPPEKADSDEKLERCYWQGLGIKPPLYGADVAGSLCDADLKGWNLRHLDTLLDRTLAAKGCELPGVSTPYLYFGMWRSTFAWHTEDKDLFSINYLHFGAPKTWYIVPPKFRTKFENALKNELQDLPRHCPEFLRHKDLMVSPKFLRDHGVEVIKVVQHPREFIVNYAGAYHSGFNHGWNCAESVNFATRSWIKIGAQARSCECNPDNVTIDMSLFLDAAHPRDRKLLRDCLPPPSSSDSDSGLDSGSDVESCSQPEDADSDSAREDFTAQLKPSHRAQVKRARSPSPSSQDSASSPAPKKRRHTNPARTQAKQQTSCHVMHPSADQHALQSTVGPVKRGRGRPRKDGSTKPSAVISRQSGPDARSAAAALRSTQPDRIRASHGLRLPKASRYDSSRAARLAQRRHKQALQASSGVLQQTKRGTLPAGSGRSHQARLHAGLKPSKTTAIQTGHRSSCNRSSEQVTLPPASSENPQGSSKPSRPQIVRSPFSFASQALRSAAQLLSLRPRKISVPVCQGTRGKTAQNV